MLATIAALPLTGALSAGGSSEGGSQSGSTSNDLAVGEIDRSRSAGPTTGRRPVSASNR